VSGGKYKVGYRKPPRSTQFRKGRSGNPKGRPKGARNLKTIVLDELQERIALVENGRRKTVTKQQALIKRLMAESLQGDNKARALILNLAMQFGQEAEETAERPADRDEDAKIIQRFADRIRRQAKNEGSK
jgi:hypothetical protein